VIKLKFLKTLSVVLVVVGGLNWGLVGLFNFNLVSALFGTGFLANVVYDLVGLAAVYVAFVELSKK
jgi:uncharacterized protein